MLAGDRCAAGRDAGHWLSRGARCRRACAPLRWTAASRICWCGTKCKPGDFFYIPANTVHAIGPGCSIIEIQQNSDITYRLYDYGRPRELHLEEGMAVAIGEPYDMSLMRICRHQSDVSLVDGPHFRLDQLAAWPRRCDFARYRGPLLVIPRTARWWSRVKRCRPGPMCAGAEIDPVRFAAEGTCLIAQPIEQ